MKKAKLFFMAILVAVTLLGFSGTSLAFDLSKITSKPVEWVKYAAKRLGFGDSDEKKAPEAKPENKIVKVKESEESAYDAESNTESTDLDPYEIDFESPLFGDKINEAFIEGLTPYYYLQRIPDSGAEINYRYIGEDWYFRLNSGSSEIFNSFTYKSADVQVWMTQMEYGAELPWQSIPFNVGFFLKSNISLQQTSKLNDPGFVEGTNEDFRFSPENMGYGLRVNALVKDAIVGLYGWYGDDTSPLSPDYLYMEAANGTSDPLWLATDSGYQGSNNIAATLSYKLPFMNFSHQGMSPTVRLEAAYRFGANGTYYRNNFGDNDQWKVGLAYEANNRIDWLNPYGINWGIGYNYTVTLNDLDTLDNSRQNYSSHSGNITANTYWFNMKLYTMFMYLYDRQTRGSMTVFNATYSPDWRWSYGIKAKFYHGKKDSSPKELNDNSERITFTATYRWD